MYPEPQRKQKKEGVFTGAYAINPMNDERIPIWIADYVLMDYGTGAIMAVPAHDQRDFEFARQYQLPIRVVIKGEDTPEDGELLTEAYEGDGVMINSGRYNGLSVEEGKQQIQPLSSKWELVKTPSITVYVIGLFPVSVIGVLRFLLSTVMIVESFLSPPMTSCLFICRKILSLNRHENHR